MNKSRQLIIEKNTENVRVECNVTDYGFKDIFEASEKLGYRTIRYPVGAEAFLGFALIKDSERIVFSNSSLILSREIFSVAHEIGHQRLHLSEQGRTLIKDDDFNDRDELEVEANYFAACLLMPMDKVEKFIRLELKDKNIENWNGLDIARIQSVFNVSYDMVLIRLKALKILGDAIIEKLKMEKIEQTASKLLNVIGGNTELCKTTEVKKIPAEFLEWVISNYNEKLIPRKSLEAALRYVDLNADDVNINDHQQHEEESFDDLLRGMD
ncbi:MAG: ImmA/IrrE family metallo-endopeptidase [Clostridiaceae bacterium]|jgi:Zn-dependent peptidase ImmA (M78 family)|nr:ImmA/IrrE family metallo-endopeptidase [Clostridiaceae bacterium]